MSPCIRGLSTATLALLLVVAAPPAHDGVSTTKHNLSATGAGALKATTESQICLFCHAPHTTSTVGQLWNRRIGSAYTPYTSSTLRSAPGQPNGASLLCLSCHDGTIALGEVLTRGTPITMTGVLAGNPLLGTNLSDDHPVSMVYDAALVAARGELANPATLVKPSPVRLDAGGRLQCTACHDPHDDPNGKFLTVVNTASALCVTCHLKNYWSGSDHRTSTKTWNGAGTNPWPHTSGTTVAANACESCHRPHTAGGSKRLLNYAAEESNCFPCHSGNVAAKNIQAEFAKTYKHTIAATTGVHDPAEAAAVPAGTRHVECVDCHNPHAANASGGAMPGSLAGVRGISLGAATVNPSANEYEICFRCHGDTEAIASSTARLISQNNKRLEFQTSNPSYHPVAGAGRSTSTMMPSLAGMTLNGVPLTASSVIKCTDCHNNNAGPGAGGTGPNGPHGSTYPRLLERNYTKVNTTESATAYALCYKCHSRTNILSDAIGSFREHNVHVRGADIPCDICHDPHGISSTQGGANNRRLINFQTPTVTAISGNAPARWERVGTNGGRCYLVCHFRSHNGWSY